MTAFPYALEPATGPRLGMIVLQTDETLESDLRRLLPPEAHLYVSRVPSGAAVTPETLSAMADDLSASAALLPAGKDYDAIGYGCTSGTAQIGMERIAELVQAGATTRAVVEPVSALIAACRAMKVRRLAMLSPYIDTVSDRLRRTLAEHDVETPVFGTFAEPEEVKVAQISEGSVIAAAKRLAPVEAFEAVFLSCTNLRTLNAIPALERALGVPVFSSNQVLAWRLLALAGAAGSAGAPGSLFAALAAAEDRAR